MKNLLEKAVMATLGVIALYAIAVGSWFFSQEKAWKTAAKQYEKAKDTYARECAAIARKPLLNDEYETAKAQMPIFDATKATDTTWQRKLSAIAATNHISIAQQQSGGEVDAGEVLELSIEVRNWEGSLEALVRFMHELENTDEGMFDIRQLNFKPSSKKGYLKGSFTLTCAYMRED